jgi:hypothetical protein
LEGKTPGLRVEHLVGTNTRTAAWRKCFARSGIRIGTVKNIFANRVRICM